MGWNLTHCRCNLEIVGRRRRAGTPFEWLAQDDNRAAGGILCAAAAREAHELVVGRDVREAREAVVSVRVELDEAL